MEAQGYGFWWHDVYWGVLTTGAASVPGRHDIYFAAVGADTHEHIWLKFGEADVEAIGTQLKDRGSHVSPATELNAFSTGVLATVRLTWDGSRGTVATELLEVAGSEPHRAEPTVTARPASSRNPTRLETLVPDDVDVVECDLAVNWPGRLPPLNALSTNLAQLEFGPDSRFGLAMYVRWPRGEEESCRTSG